MPAPDCWRIDTLAPGDEKDYADLVARVPASPLTHTLAWRNVLTGQGPGEPVYWLAHRAGRLRGALPAFVYRTEAGAVLNSLPFIQSTGGVLAAADADAGERAGLT